MYGEYGFNSVGSWSYFREWVDVLITKLCHIPSGKRNVIEFTIQESVIRYILLKDYPLFKRAVIGLVS